MSIDFQWMEQPSQEQKGTIEDELSAVYQDKNIAPCHPGTIVVTLGVTGPLENTLEASAKCTCGKKLIDISGDPSASRLTLKIYE